MSLIDDVKELADLVDKSKHLDLFRKILDVQGEALKLMEENNNLKQEIHQLKKTANLTELMKFVPPVYYIANDETPFCPKCWEVENLLSI